MNLEQNAFTPGTDYLASTRAVLDIQAFPSMKYYMQAFPVPGISANAPKAPFSGGLVPFTPDKLTFEEVQITFIIDRDMRNWFQVYKWMRRNSFLQDGYDPVRTDGVVTIFNNHQNPIARVKLFDMIPTFLSGIDIVVTDVTTREREATAAFAIRYYDLELLTNETG